MHVTSAVAFVVTALLGQVGAEAPAQRPEVVVERYLEALKAGRYEEMSALMEPGALVRFRDMLLPVLVVAPTQAGGDPVFLLPGVADKQAAQVLSGEAFLAAFFRGLAKQNPAFSEGLRSASGETIGSVPEGPNTLHVVCRSRVRVGELAMTKMTVVTLRLVDGRWRIGLSGELEGMAESLRRALGGAPGGASSGGPAVK